MTSTRNPFDTINKPVAQRTIDGLAKICTALRSQSWQGAESQGLTPTQGQILALLLSKPNEGTRLSAIAEGIATSPATASDAISTLVQKKFVSRERAADDRRAIAVRLTTEGRQQAKRVKNWPDFLLNAVEAIPAEEQAVFFKGLTTIIQRLQEEDKIPVSRMCVTCHYFTPHAYDDLERPHHCNLVDAPFGSRDLRLDCPEHLSKTVNAH